MTDFAQICAGSDTAIFIVSNDSMLCREMLALMRSAGTLSSNAAAVFESNWRMYLEMYADAGGAFGALIHYQLRKRGPVVVMGELGQLARITEMLTFKAREITRTELTPMLIDPIFETTVRAVAAEMSQTEGSA